MSDNWGLDLARDLEVETYEPSTELEAPIGTVPSGSSAEEEYVEQHCVCTDDGIVIYCLLFS